MTWFRVDDGFWSHPKSAALSDAATALWARAGSYCCQHLTDGHVTAHALRLLGGRARTADELVESGLWVKVNGGYSFHDWEHYQESSEVILARRANARERQRKVRAQREKKQHDTRMQSLDVSHSDIACDIASDSRAEFSTPSPTRPDPTITSSSTRGVSSGSSARAETAPPSKCPKHTNDPHPPNCGACATAREARESWDAEQRRAASEQKSREARSRADASALAIRACGMCDSDGYVGATLCDHDPGTAERAKRGLAAARAALNGGTDA